MLRVGGFWQFAAVLAVLITGGPSAAGLAAQESGNEDSRQVDLTQLEYRHIGPIGNRVSAVTGVAGDRNIYFVGAASGGVWKSTDAGVHWKPVFDEQPVQSIGSIAVSRSDSNVVWVGTGESKVRSNISHGMGVYKSVDGGESWELKGLEEAGRVSRVIIHPENPDIVYVAALGHLYGPQKVKGVWRTRDGGETWEQVLFVDENTGPSDLVMDPNNPRVLLAGMWEMEIRTWGRTSGGSAGGLFISRDAGDSWEKLTGKGLPDPPTGRIGLAMTSADSSRVYALIETNVNRDFAELTEHQGDLWRSDDGGRSWKLVNSNNAVVQRPHYYSRMAAAPDDPDEVHFLATLHTRSLDGGKTIEDVGSGGDHHAMWIDPLLPDRMIVGHDGGISISVNRGETWMRPQLPIAQMYHVATDNEIPYNVYGNRQDGASARGPSNSLTGGEIPIGAWQSVGGCESGFAIPDPVDSSIVWSGCYEGILDRYDHRTGHSRNVMVWPDNPEGWPAAPLRYRFQWTFPVAISPHDHQRVYVGSQHVHVTEDGGQSYQVISPDLTTNDKSKQQKTGGLTPDDVSPTYAAVLFAIAESPLTEGEIWAGSNDGRLHLTRDGGASWSDLSANLPQWPEWGTVSNIEPSRHQSGKAYLTVDAHQINDFDPYVYVTEDWGSSWRRIDSGLPRHPLSWTHCVREDPRREGLLYVGTENALHISFDDGASWRSLQNNLPHAPVHWIDIQPHFNDLVVATYGRGFWILDDITPLQNWQPDSLSEDIQAHLFPPRPAYRFRQKEPPRSHPYDAAAGDDPQYGATIHYYLPGEPEEDGDDAGAADPSSPEGGEGSSSGEPEASQAANEGGEPAEVEGPEVRIEILNADGEVIRTLPDPDEGLDEDVPGDRPWGHLDPLPAKPGINRVVWDLRHRPSKLPRLRTKPLEASQTALPDRGWRPLV
ncbi:MAG TPA: hypothetical protein VLV83_05330, partial [Acidobacteriota bacterium]|nr:hypothetical protein [Acidobacteriota bacterium]